MIRGNGNGSDRVTRTRVGVEKGISDVTQTFDTVKTSVPLTAFL